MIMIYKTIPAATIRKDAKESKAMITKWFKDNPERKECNAKVWYGDMVVVHPDTIDAAMKKAIGKTKKTKETKKSS